MARDDRQGNQGSGAGDRVPQRRAAGQGRRQGQRRGARQVPVDGRHGAGADAQLRPVQGADALPHRRPAEEVRQDLRRHRQELRQGRPATARWTTSRSAAPTAGTSCSSPACGSRICSTTTSAAPRCASSRTRTQQGEISFCAYNTGIGWRNIIEKMHMTATLTKWYEEHGRHEIFAGNKNVPLAEQGALADAERRGGGRRRADRPRRARHRQERARREARRRARRRR